MAKQHFDRTKPHLNVGTMGHTNETISVIFIF